MKIKVPATSANLGVGFDTLGLSVSLYNEFEITRSYKDELIGFDDDLDDNLVYRSYRAFLANKGLPHHAVTIKLVQNDVPISRGLGSSATCILAGVFAANDLAHIHAPFDECVAFAADLEGHPDNIYAAAYGGLCAVLTVNDEQYYQTYPVSKKLHFTVLYPEAQTSTSAMREVLPTSVPFADAIHNISRIVQLPKAFEKGDIKKIKIMTEDKLHEPYRMNHLVVPDQVKQLRKQNEVAVLISGSGSALLTISEEPLKVPAALKQAYKVVPVETGATIHIEITN